MTCQVCPRLFDMASAPLATLEPGNRIACVTSARIDGPPCERPIAVVPGSDAGANGNLADQAVGPLHQPL